MALKQQYRRVLAELEGSWPDLFTGIRSDVESKTIARLAERLGLPTSPMPSPGMLITAAKQYMGDAGDDPKVQSSSRTTKTSDLPADAAAGSW
jgi:hypothetical protein